MPSRGHIALLQGRWTFWGAIVLIASCFALGGSSRAEVVQLALLRPLAIAWTAVLLCFAPTIDWRSVRWPGGLLLALALVMMLQLVPLPFSWWTAMPGRALAREAMVLSGQAGGAHGWSLMPDRTLNSLLALTVPAAMIVTMAALDARDRRRLLPWLVAMIAIHMLLCFLQLLVGSSGRFRPFSTTDMESAVGFFANRNHGAVLLAAALPLAAGMAGWPQRHRRARTGLRVALVVGAILAILAILAIGSRAGLVMAVLGLALAAGLLWPDVRRGTREMGRTTGWALALGLVATVALLVALAVLGARDEAIRRLVGLNAYDDIRIQSLPTSVAMMKDLLPFGSGFGTFEPMYRAAEPRALLHLRYLNHAHNDWLEVLIDAGLAGAAVLAAATGWFLVRVVQVVIGTGRSAAGDVLDGFDRRLAQAAAAVLAIAALASITDYPIRTPIWMLVSAIAAVWLAGPGSAVIPKSHGSRSR